MEKDLQKKCVEYARQNNLMVYSINPPNFKHMTYGTLMQLPDLHIVDYNAYFELKDLKWTKANPERQKKQKARRHELVAHGAKAYKVDTFEKFITILEFLNGKEKANSK